MYFQFLQKKINYRKPYMKPYNSSQGKKKSNYSNNIQNTKKAFSHSIDYTVKKPKPSIQIAVSEKYRSGFWRLVTGAAHVHHRPKLPSLHLWTLTYTFILNGIQESAHGFSEVYFNALRHCLPAHELQFLLKIRSAEQL